MPRDIRHMVKSAYYDKRSHNNGENAYLVKMEDKTSWKTIKIVDGEMETMEESIKSK